jgi:hypothetical protein
MVLILYKIIEMAVKKIIEGLEDQVQPETSEEKLQKRVLILFLFSLD